MHRFLVVVTTGLVFAVSSPLNGQDLLLDRFRDYIESLRIQSGIPGLAAAIVGNTDVIWEQALGKQDVERSIVTRTDTPFPLDSLTQVFSATLTLLCVEQGAFSLDDRIGKFRPDSSDAAATIRQLLSHTSVSVSGSLVFAYRPERLEPLKNIIRSCTGDSFRETLSNFLEHEIMYDSVPGADVIYVAPPDEGVPTPAQVLRYTGVLERLATPYAIDARGRATVSQYTATTLTPGGGLISTVQDFAKFMLQLRKGEILRPETLAVAWRPPLDLDGQRLPHGLGWFVQTYNGEPVVWQFGAGENGSSSLAITVPARGLTLIMMANSNRLVKPFSLATGDLTVSPFARVFLNLFVR
jgi:CubicO group peptidase (beta-lactamase class C family)